MIGALVGAASSIFGGIQNARAARKMKRELDRERRDNDQWYNREYKTDATQRADAQAMLTQVRDAMHRQNRAATGRQAVMGTTEDGLAAQKERTNDMMSNAARGIVAQADRRRDSIENQYRGQRQNIQNRLNAMRQSQMNNTAEAIKGVGSAAGSIGEALETAFPGKPKKKAAQTTPEQLKYNTGIRL